MRFDNMVLSTPQRLQESFRYYMYTGVYFIIILDTEYIIGVALISIHHGREREGKLIMPPVSPTILRVSTLF